LWPKDCAMSDERTTVAVLRYIEELARDSTTEPVV
jgi:hypothetical protein